MRGDLLLIGSGAVAVGIFPTPDDITIISPVIQVFGGLGLIVAGLVLPSKK